MSPKDADLIFSTDALQRRTSAARWLQALAIKDGRILATAATPRFALSGSEDRSARPHGDSRLIDSHSHPIRGGLYYNLELRWDGVPSLADGLRMLREQAQRTPPNQWVRVVGGWSEFQFAESACRRSTSSTPRPGHAGFVLNLYAMALLNRAACARWAMTKHT